MKKTRIGFIGSGAVAKALGTFFQLKGHVLTGYYSKNEAHAQLAAALNKTVAYKELERIIDVSDILCIAVNDDALETVVRQISACCLNLNGKMVFHTSGVHSSDVLKPLVNHGANVLSIHPLQAFSNHETSVAQLPLTVFSIEGMVDSKVEAFMQDMGLKYMVIEAGQKIHYHLSAVIVSNFLVGTIDFGIRQMQAIGIEESLAREALWPLIENTLNNIKSFGARDALTGPIARGDVNTVKKHQSVLEDEDLQLYNILGQCILDIARKKGLNASSCEALKQQLMEV